MLTLYLNSQNKSKNKYKSKSLEDILGNEEGLKALVREVMKISEEFPHVQYKMPCLYKPNQDNPRGCIIGFALRRLGCTQADEENRVISIYGLIARYHLHIPLHSPEFYLQEWLAQVQDAQDQGTDWRYCVQRANTAQPKVKGWVENGK